MDSNATSERQETRSGEQTSVNSREIPQGAMENREHGFELVELRPEDPKEPTGEDYLAQGMELLNQIPVRAGVPCRTRGAAGNICFCDAGC